MATDTLTTIIELQGLAQAVAGLGQMATAAAKAARETDNLAQQWSRLNRLFTAGPGLTGGGGGIGAQTPWNPSGIASIKGAVSQTERLAQAYELLAGRANPLLKLGGDIAEVFGKQPMMWLAIGGAVAVATRAIQGVVRWLGQAMQAGDQLNQSLARTLVLMQNQGRPGTPGGVSQFALQRMRDAGIAPAATMDLFGQIIERGVAPGMAPRLTEAAQEIEAGTGGRMSGIRAIETFLRGEFQTERGRFTRQGMLGLAGGRAQVTMGTRLGLSIRWTGSFEHDLQAFVRAVEGPFTKVAEAMTATASGVHQRVQLELATATAQLGQVIEAMLLPEMEGLIAVLHATNNFFSILLHGGGTTQQQLVTGGLAGGLASIFGGPIGALISGLSLNAARGREADLNRIDPGGIQRQQLDHLAHMDATMSGLAGQIVQILFGRGSSFTRQAGALDFVRLNAAISSRT